MIMYSAVLVVVPMVVVGVVSYHKSSKVLEEETERYSLQLIDQVKYHVEDYIRDIEINMIKITNNPDVIRFLRMRTSEEIVESGIREQIRQVLMNAAYSRSDISNITLFLEDVQIIDSSFRGTHYPAANVVNEYWYQSLPMNGETKVISRVIKLQEREQPVITIVRRLFSPQTLEPVGLIMFDVNFKRLEEMAKLINVGRTGYMFILDEQGHYVYSPALGNIGKPFELFSAEQMQKAGRGSFILESETPYFYIFSHSFSLKWTLVTAVPYRELTENIGHIGRTILITVTITLILAYLLAAGLAASIVRPIRKLQQVMKRVEVGDFDNKVDIEAKDEIGYLSHGFNHMAAKLRNLLEEVYVSKLRETELSLRQRETELKVLQSQMNPHFLYNSLETIRGMALMHDRDEIADMSAALAKLMRYNVKTRASTVTLEQEMRMCGVYLTIQKYRYEDKLDYVFDIPDWALDQLLVKFSLQPLVENCVVHGVETGVDKVSIRITAIKDSDSCFIVEVHDDGAGITPERLQFIYEKLEDDDVSSGGAHIGVANVHRRTQFIFGEEYGITIESGGELKGTAVRIRLPYRDIVKKGEASG
ncbi:sensor histidine kinase [Paenibacillus turpanensis]|uniref:sensor histidine kinase n=1 Tax=Paenibacillus turpanensis TaxID=2689078 RepID=UPI00140D43B1|nr:sensor histidine kinase [Paenibacillus turpanensis]